MTKYSEKNNIYYDLIIRSRFDQCLYNIFYNSPKQNAVEKIYRKDALHVDYPMVNLTKNFKGFQFNGLNTHKYLTGKHNPIKNKATGNAILFNMLCPRFTINKERKLWMEFAVMVSSSNIINSTTMEGYFKKLIELTVKEKSHKDNEKGNSVIETSSHWVMAEYLIQHFKCGISTIKPALPWQYKLNHLPRTMLTVEEYKKSLNELIEKEKTRKTDLYTRNKF